MYSALLDPGQHVIHELLPGRIAWLHLVQGEVQVKGLVKDAIASSPPREVAILDFRLPDGTGIEIAERLRSRNPGVRIRFVTGYGVELEGRLPTRLVDLDRMEKPVDLVQLLDWVAAALGKGGAKHPAS